MKIFDNIIHNKLIETHIIIPKDNLDSYIFDFREDGKITLKDATRIQILKDIDEIRKIIPVVNFYIVGDVLTSNNKKSEISVMVQSDPQNIDNISTADIMHSLKYINGRFAISTIHPINYYIITDELDDNKYDAIYDVLNDKWKKTPETYTPEIEKIIDNFYETLNSIDISSGDLKNNLIDMDEIKNLDSKKIKKIILILKQKLQQLNELLKRNIEFDHLAKSINQNIQQNSSIEEINLFKNKIPEIILFKLLEKYYHFKIIKTLEDILNERDDLSLSDNPYIKKAMQKTWKIS